MAETSEQVLNRYDAKNRFLAVISAWMSGDLSESQACRLAGVAAIDLREVAEEYKTVAHGLWERYRKTGETINDDMMQAVAKRPVCCRHGGD